MRTLYASIGGVTGILSVSISDGHGTQMGSATIECIDTTLDIGDDIIIDIGYEDDHGIVFTGYVKQIDEEASSSHTYTIVASNVLIRAADYFIVSTNPDDVMKVANISPEALIEQLLDMAGLEDYNYQVSSYIWGVAGDIEIQLVSVYDYCKTLADMIAWGFWADEDGSIWFTERKPYPMGTDPIVATITTDEVISLKDWKSDKNLRNKVVVWGSAGIYAEAHEESPYLPEGFYKTAVVSAPGIIDNQEMAQSACEYNLDLYNRLTVGYTVSVVGNHLLNARKVIHLDSTDEDLYIYATEHSWGKTGYVCNMDLRKE